MKAKLLLVILSVFLLCTCNCFSQDMEATKQYLEIQLEIMELQATIDAMQNQNSTFQPGNSVLKVGDTFLFGHYEQDNNQNNGTEPIEWQVLAVENDRVLVISKYALDSKPYHYEWSNTTWEKCSLRSWINGEFYNKTFNSTEKDMIIEVKNKNPNNQIFGTSGGNSSKDRVFILSDEEAAKYFPNDKARQFSATAYAAANRKSYVYKGNGYPVTDIKYDDNGRSWWWLRTPGIMEFLASNVYQTGEINYEGEDVYYTSAFVRPAFWMKK